MTTSVTYGDKPPILNQKKTVFNAGVEASLEYIEPSKSYSPQVKLLFSPFGVPFIPLEILGTDVGSIIRNMNWNKDRNNPGGILQLDITPSTQVIESIVNILNKVTGNLYSSIWGELGVDLEDLFKPMTVCQLWVNDIHVMTGTVRSCIRNSSVQNKDYNVSYSLTIDELGNFYNNDILSFDTIALDNMQLNLADSNKDALELVSGIKAIPLATGITALLEAFRLTMFGKNYRMSLSDGLPLFLRLLATANPIGGIANLSFAQNMIVDTNMFQLHSSGGAQSFWSFLKSFIPNPWMELYTESGGRTMVTDALGAPSVLFPGFNYVVARSVPYSNPLLGIVNPTHLAQTTPFDLTTIQMLLFGDFIIITDDDIQDKSLGFDSVNQKTIFHARYGAGGAVNPPDLTDKSIKTVGPLNPLASGGLSTFGNKDFFSSINCTHLVNFGTGASYVERIAKNTVGLPTQIMSKPALANLLATWFRNQSRFREGTVTTRLLPYARPGMYCLYLPALSGKKAENIRDIGIYYIDSLSHNYSLENTDVTFSTTLQLIRGTPLPTSVAQTALLLFDYDVLPPESGFKDGEYATLQALRNLRGGLTL
jgi:hypothetical protein